MKMIKIDKLYPHPQNPRRDVGDISELSESIKANGVYQNLTVIEGGPGVPQGEEGYTVIIGHRRSAAAKVAGLTELPCAVVEMDEKTQVSTMLLENMQRSDLTAYEQAQGFQLMLDLGETQTSISEKTGFSVSTISKRLKLATLDNGKFKAAVERGGTLEDYVQVARIRDKKERDSVLEAVGTDNFKWTLAGALRKQKKADNLPKIKKELNSFANECKETNPQWNSSKWETKLTISIEDWKLGDCIPESMNDKEELYWYISNMYAYVLKKVPQKKKVAPKITAQEKAADAKRDQLKELTLQAYKLRKEFVEGLRITSKNKDIIIEWVMDSIIAELCSVYKSCNRKLVTEKIDDINAIYVDQKKLCQYYGAHPDTAPILLVYAYSGDSEGNGYYFAAYRESMPQHKENEGLDHLYSYLTTLGYQMSDVEKQLQDGSHKVFK